MAFTARTPEYYDSGNSATGTVSVPSGTQDGDILFALIAWKNAYGVDLTEVPSGWDLVASTGIPNTDKYILYTRIADSEPADYTWTTIYAPSFPGYLRIAMYAYTAGDFDGADPIDVVSNTVYTTWNTTLRAASMTVTAGSSPALFFGILHQGSDASFTKPSNIGSDVWTEDDDSGDGSGSEFQFTVDSIILSDSGATGDMDGTCADAPAKHAFAVALNPASATAYTLTASGGTFAEAGTVAGLRATRKLTVGSGSFSETGTAATLAYVKGLINAGSGVFNVTGTAAGLRATRILVPGSGAFVETGTAAGLIRNYPLSAVGGSFTFSDTGSSLLYKRILSVDSGVYVLTMTPADLIYFSPTYLLNAGSGMFLISGGTVYFPRPGASRICYTFQKRRDHFRT